MRGLALLAGLALMTAAAGAQNLKAVQTGIGDGGSPHWHTEWLAGGAHITIDYGRPFLKGRTVGLEVAPYGTEWRTGADAATTLSTDKPLQFGSLKVPAGTYTLYTVPDRVQWILIISKKTGQWGIPYPQGEDLGRVPMQLDKNPAPVEELTITVDSDPHGGVLHVRWGYTDAHIAFRVEGK